MHWLLLTWSNNKKQICIFWSNSIKHFLLIIALKTNLHFFFGCAIRRFKLCICPNIVSEMFKYYLFLKRLLHIMTCVLHKAYFSRNCGFSFIIIVFLQFSMKELSEKDEVWEFRILEDLGTERLSIERPGLRIPGSGIPGSGIPGSGIACSGIPGSGKSSSGIPCSTFK